MKRARKAPRTLDLLDWNVGASRAPDDVMKQLRHAVNQAGRPAVITLHEAWPYDSAITQALPDYRMHEASGGFKADDNIILTRRDKAPAGRFAALRMKLRWTGPKSPRRLNQPPRTWPVLDIGFRKWRVVSLHNPTRAGNEKARDEGFGRLVKLAKQRGSKRRGLLIVGDFNGDPRPLAKAIGGEVVKGYHVDHAVVRGATGKRVAVLDKHGSDHHPVLYRFTRD